MERKICTKCSTCRQRTVAFATVPYQIQIDYEGRKFQVSIPDLSVPKCANCGQIYFDDEASQQVTRAFCKHAGLLNGDEIRQEREKLELTPEKLASMLGVEAAEVARWELGKQIQQRVADRFLRALFTLPELRAKLAGKHVVDLSSV